MSTDDSVLEDGRRVPVRHNTSEDRTHKGHTLFRDLGGGRRVNRYKGPHFLRNLFNNPFKEEKLVKFYRKTHIRCRFINQKSRSRTISRCDHVLERTKEKTLNGISFSFTGY